MKTNFSLSVLLLALTAALTLPSCSDDDDPEPTKKLVRFELTVTPASKLAIYYGRQVTAYGDWEYEFYTDNVSNVWFDCTSYNDTALLVGKIYIDGKFAVMAQGNRYVDVAYAE